MAKGILGILLMSLSFNSIAQTCMEYDKNVDFSGYETFSFEGEEIIQNGKKIESSPEFDIIKNNLRSSLISKGLVQDNDNPDILVSFISETESDTTVENVPPVPVFYGPGTWTDDGYASVETAGVLIIDMKDSKTHKTIWRSGKDIPVKKRKKQNKVYRKNITKIMNNYPPGKR